MQIYPLDPQALLGGIIASDAHQEVVQMVLHKGNQTAPYQIEAIVLLLVLAGSVEVQAGGESLRLGPYQLLRLEPQERHSLSALEDGTMLLAVKQFLPPVALAER